MSGIIISGFLLIIIVGAIIYLFYRVNKDKSIGKDFMIKNSEHHPRSAPPFYFDKQQMFRKYYGFLIGIHYFLLISSISLTTLTIYMVIDTKLNDTVRVTISVLAAITTTLHTILNFEKMGSAYISAMRVIEQAILEYESAKDDDLDILLKANIKAEEIIHNIFQ